MERMFQDFKLAKGVTPELAVLLRGFGQVQAEHQLLRGLRELTRRKEPVFWLTFALQVFLDIRHVRENVALAFTDLRHGADLITKSIKEFLEFHDESAVFTHSDTNSWALREVLNLVGRWTQVDTVGETRRGFQLDSLFSNHIPEFYLLTRDPLWCGLLLYNFRSVVYEGAIMASNMGSSVVAAAHVHNCLQQEMIITQQWADMDTVVSTHGVKGIFIGDLPHSSKKEYGSRYALALGISPVGLARNPRKSHVKLSADKRRTLQRQAPVYWMFKNRYCDNSGQVNFEPRDVEAILSRGAKAAGRSVNSKSEQRTNVSDPLARLATALHHETLEVTFDYFQMHMVCWGILRRLGRDLGPQMAAHFDFGRDERDPLSLLLLLLSDGVAALQRKLILDAGHNLAPILASDGGRVTTKRTAFLIESITRRSSASHGRSNDPDA